MKIITFIILTCLLSSTTAFSQPEEIHSFTDTSAGYFNKVLMDIKVVDGLIIAGMRNVNNVPQPMIAKINVSGEIVWSAAAPSLVPATSYNSNMTIKLFEDGYVYGSYFQWQELQLLWKVNAQTGEVAWIVPFASEYNIVQAYTELDSTRFAAVYSNSQYDTRLAIFNKTTGAIIQQSQITSSTHHNTALDGYGNLYLSFKNQVLKYNGTDLDQIVWQRNYLDGTTANQLDEIHKMYLDPFGDIYLFGRNGYGDGLIVRISPFTGEQIWKAIISSDNVRIADFVDRNNCIYITYRHTLTGGGTYKWQTAKIAKNNGQILWSNMLHVTPQASASTNTDKEQAALSLDVDCNGDIYQTGYYAAENYGPGNWGIMKLDGSTGAKLYDLTISEDSTAADTQSQGTVAAVFGNTPVILGQVEIGTSYTTKALYVSINPANGTIVSRHDIMAGHNHRSSVADILHSGSSSFVLKQVGFALKVKHYLNGNPSWEAVIPGSDITFGKKLAASTSSVYVFGRKVLSSVTPPFYQQTTNQLALYKINRTNGAIQNTHLISTIPGDSRPLQLIADNTNSYLFYSKGDSIYYRSWNGVTLSSEFLLDSLSQYQASTENMSIIHNEATRLIVATSSGIYQINKSTMAKTLFLSYPQQMEVSSVSGMGNSLYIVGRSGTDALAASIDLTASSINWLTTYSTADNFTQISTDGYFLYVSAKDGTTESVRQLALSDGTENWAQNITGGGNTVSSLTLTPAKNHDYVVVGGKITESSGASNAFITMFSYDGTLLENYELDDELGTESYLSTSAAINDSTVWIGGVYNTTSQPESGRVFSVAYTTPPVSQIVTDSACLSYTWQATGLTYTTSGVYSQTITNPFIDTVLTLNLTILNPSTSSQTVGFTGPYTWPVNGQTYTTPGIYVDTIPNAAGCDSIITLNLTLHPLSTVNVFAMPSDIVECTGTVAFTLSGTPDFTIDIGDGNPITTDGYAYFDSLCPGIHSAFITDGNGNTLSASFVIPSDSTYIFNNPFVDSLALDSLGIVVDNCDIYYNSIDSAYIANIFVNADTIIITWEIVDSSGVTSIVTSYILDNGSGVYNLQLSIFCPQKSTEEYFTVTQTIYFDGSEVYLLGIKDLAPLSISIHPNPTTDLITIIFTAPSLDLLIYESSGKIISEHKLNSGQQISLGKMQAGVYFFDMRLHDGKHVVKRVVKN